MATLGGTVVLADATAHATTPVAPVAAAAATIETIAIAAIAAASATASRVDGVGRIVRILVLEQPEFRRGEGRRNRAQLPDKSRAHLPFLRDRIR